MDEKESEIRPMSEEELERISGGTILETFQNFVAFQTLKLIPRDAEFSAASADVVANIFKDNGIRVLPYNSLCNSNQYFYGDKQIDMTEALQIVCNNLKNK